MRVSSCSAGMDRTPGGGQGGVTAGMISGRSFPRSEREALFGVEAAILRLWASGLQAINWSIFKESFQTSRCRN